MMKKYLSIIALCAANLAYADGFENLKSLQDQVPALIYNAGDLGATTSAPEVPYIAGLLTNPVASIGADEERHIYEFLYDKFSGRNRKMVHGIDQAKADAFNTINFKDLMRYNNYQHSGHSLFGIAAQELLPPIQKVAVNAPVSVVSPAMSMKAPGLFGGGGNPFSGGISSLKKSGATVEKAVTAPVSAPKSLLDRVKEYKATSRNKVDIELLAELEAELSSSSSAKKSARHDDLVEFFNLLTTEGPGMKDVVKQGKLEKDIKELRVKLKPKDAATSSKDPAIPVAASTKRVNEASLLSDNNTVLDKFINSGNSSVNLDTMSNPDLQKLKRLKIEKEDLEEDEDDDWDSDDGKPQKTAAQKKLDAARVVELNAEILALAESLAIEGVLLDSDVIDDSNNRVDIYRRIKAALESVDRSIGKKDSIYQSVNAKLVGLRGGVAEKSSVVAASKDNLSLSPLPVGENLVGGGGVVAAADITKEQIIAEINRLATQPGDKRNIVASIKSYLDGLPQDGGLKTMIREIIPAIPEKITKPTIRADVTSLMKEITK